MKLSITVDLQDLCRCVEVVVELGNNQNLKDTRVVGLLL